MKPFSLEEYLANPSRKVVTRDGRKVTRFLCTDAITDFPIIALIEATPGSTNESLCTFKKDGRYFEDVNSNCDLFFAPTIVNAGASCIVRQSVFSTQGRKPRNGWKKRTRAKKSFAPYVKSNGRRNSYGESSGR